MKWDTRDVEQPSRFVPVSVTLEFDTPWELIEFFWRMSLSNGEIETALKGRMYKNCPRVPNLAQTSSMQGISRLRSRLKEMVHTQHFHTTKAV